MKNFDWKTAVKSFLLLALAGFLASRLLTGTLNFYIHPRFNGLTLATAAILFILGIGYGWQLLQKPVSTEDHHHDHDIPWTGLLILAIPVLLGFFVPPKPLGANALTNRELNFSLTAAQNKTGENIPLAPDEQRNILDWLYDFQRQEEAVQFNGRFADVTGFVYRDDRFGDEQFMVSRFTINCCVADANPVGLIVQTADAAQFDDDSWVQVTGHFTAQTIGGEPAPVLIVETITAVSAPAQPYLYE